MMFLLSCNDNLISPDTKKIKTIPLDIMSGDFDMVSNNLNSGHF